MHGPREAPARAFVSGLLLTVLMALPRVAGATVCTLPSDCFSVGEVCNLGICTPCGSNFSDGGLNGGLLSCQDPALPICDVPDGSVGGQCVQCTENENCSGGEVCDQGTQTCVSGDAGSGDAGIQDAGESDASLHDGGSEADATAPTDAASREDAAVSSDAASSSDGASEETDGASVTGDGAASDGASSEDAAAPFADGASPTEDAAGGGLGDATLGQGSVFDDGAYVEGGGCSCNEIGGSGSAGGAVLAFIVALAGIRRRRSR
jgi:hypothetical protein